MDAKKNRSVNMTPVEKGLSADLCVKYNAIDNKKNDGATVKMKEGAWHTLAAEFQATSTSGIHREWTQLKTVSLS
jgi:hypothetical protein